MTKRPKAIRIICIIGFTQCAALPVFAVLAAFLLPNSPDFVGFTASLDRTLLSLFAGWWTIMLVSMVGIWRMRKWGPILYAALVVVIWCLWLPGPPVGDSIMAGLSLFYLRQMTWGPQLDKERIPGAVELTAGLPQP